MTIYPWPAEIEAQAGGFFPRGMTVAGPPSLSGLIQVGQTDVGHWRAELKQIRVIGPDRINAYRGFVHKLEGGANLCRVPVFDADQRPWPQSGGADVAATAATGFSDGTQFSDGTGFAEKTIRVWTSGAHAAGTTQLSAIVGYAGTIKAGQYFTLAGRLHVIRDVLASNGPAQTWWIWPRLRRSIGAGVPLDFDNPTCLMRLADESAADLLLDYGSRGFPDLQFVEAFGAETVPIPDQLAGVAASRAYGEADALVIDYTTREIFDIRAGAIFFNGPIESTDSNNILTAPNGRLWHSLGANMKESGSTFYYDLITAAGSWLDPAQGTVFALFYDPDAEISQTRFVVNPYKASAPGADRADLTYRQNAGNDNAIFRVLSSSAVQLSQTSAAVPATGFHAMALAWDTNDGNSAIDGTADTADTSLTAPVDLDSVAIGNSRVPAADQSLSGILMQLIILPDRRSNATLAFQTDLANNPQFLTGFGSS